MFLTDGDDTTKKDPTPALNELRKAIDELPCTYSSTLLLFLFSSLLNSLPGSAVVHSVGFTKEHKFDVLNELRMIGKEKGKTSSPTSLPSSSPHFPLLPRFSSSFVLFLFLFFDLTRAIGVFQYAEPSDGPQALQKKLEGIFDYVSLSGSKVQIQL